MQRLKCCGVAGENSIGPHCHELGRRSPQKLGAATGPAVFDADVAPVDPSQLFKLLLERLNSGSRICIVFVYGNQHPDAA